jgi:hypothetical protein
MPLWCLRVHILHLCSGMRASVHVDLPGWTKEGLPALKVCINHRQFLAFFRYEKRRANHVCVGPGKPKNPCAFIFLKSTRKDIHFDTQHDLF